MINNLLFYMYDPYARLVEKKSNFIEANCANDS